MQAVLSHRALAPALCEPATRPLWRQNKSRCRWLSYVFREFGSVRCVVAVVFGAKLVRYVAIESRFWSVCRVRPLVGFHLSDP